MKDGDEWPPTYPYDQNMSYEENKQLYNACTISIYSAIREKMYPKYVNGMRILNNYRGSNDGYRVLYALASVTNRSLNTNAFHVREPIYDSKKGLYEYRDQFIRHVQYKQSMNPQSMNQVEIADTFISHLHTAQVYGNGISEARNILNGYTQRASINPNSTPFPIELRLEELPNTILRSCNHDVQDYEKDLEAQYYSEVMHPGKRDDYTHGRAFRTSGDNQNENDDNIDEDDDFEEGFAIVNRMSSNTKSTRPAPDPKKRCKACGTVGHEIEEDGCSFCVKVMYSHNYYKKDGNEATMKQAVRKFISQQRDKKQYLSNKSEKKNHQDKAPRSNRRPRGVTRAMIAEAEKEAYLDTSSSDDETTGSKFFDDNAHDSSSE